MKFSIIGTGNTAYFFAKKLSQAGHQCIGIYGRTAENAAKLAATINAPVINSIDGISDDADCCIIAISDKAIEEVVGQLSFSKTVLIHTAGSVQRTVLDHAAIHNAVVWPIYSINKEDIPQHRDIPIVVEISDENAGKVTSELINSISNKFFAVSGEQRCWLHLSAVLSNNFANHLFAISEQICKEHMLPFPILQPIINQTIERIQNQSPYETQTGPAKRNDQATIDKHVNMLDINMDWQELYESITTSIDNMYKQGVEDKHDM